MRKRFEISEADWKGLLDRINTARGTPLIALQCGMPQSPQEAANAAWMELGERMGFDGMSVEPTGEGERIITAETEGVADAHR